MKYKYINVTGTSEIEVCEQFNDILTGMDNDWQNSDRKHVRRHPLSLENAKYEGDWFSDDADPLNIIIQKDESKQIRIALSKLTDDQRELVRQLYIVGIAPSEIARREGVNKSAISHRQELIRKKLKIFLE